MAKKGKHATGFVQGTLTKKEIIETAYALIDEQGVSACSMRGLGDRMKTSAMAMYNHIPSRDKLLNEVCKRFLEHADTRGLRGERWQDTAARFVVSLQRLCIAQPHLAELLLEPCVAEGREPYMLAQRLVYLDQGMPEEIAVRLCITCDAYLAGFLLRARQNRDMEQAEVEPEPFAAASRIPGMLTGWANEEAPLNLNENWRISTHAGYTEEAFIAGLVAIIDGIAASHPASNTWRTAE